MSQKEGRVRKIATRTENPNGKIRSAKSKPADPGTFIRRLRRRIHQPDATRHERVLYITPKNARHTLVLRAANIITDHSS